MVIEATSIVGSQKGLEYQANDDGLAVEISRNGLFGNDPKEWHKQMRSVENLKHRIQNKRLSILIAPSKEVSSKLNRNDWENLIDKYFEKQGINKDDYQYIAHFHNSTDDKHVHITASRISFQNRKVIDDSYIGKKAGIIADKIAKENNWKTAKEISKIKRDSISQALRISLRTAKNFIELEKKMLASGFVVKISENESRGVYGLRIIPIEDINTKIKNKDSNSRQGYKLSELEKFSDRKAKFSINDIKISFERNTFKELSNQDKLTFINSKNEKLFNEDSNQSNIESETNESSKDKSILEILLNPNYTSSSDDELTRKKKKKKR